jgi:CRP-like cAMP-binding protein
MPDHDVQTMSIGEFAALVGLTPRALRRYGEAGVLEPVHVDPQTGYRSYAPAQAADGRLVALLRRLEMAVADIKLVLQEPDVSSRWRRVAVFWSAQRQRLAERERLLERVREELVGSPERRRYEPSDLDALPEPARSEVLRAMAAVPLPEGVPVFAQGDTADALYLVVSGAVRVMMTFPEADVPVEVATLGPGRVFGELGLLDGSPRAATVAAADDCHLLRLDAESFAELRAAHPELEHLLRSVAANR